jgi:hypothetical protein
VSRFWFTYRTGFAPIGKWKDLFIKDLLSSF